MTLRTSAVLAIALIGGAAVAANTDIVVTPVVTGGHVVASFSAPGSVFDDAREAIESGLLLTFTYSIELRRPAGWLWFDRTLVDTSVGASVKFDALTGVYQVSKLRDGRVVWSERSDKEADVRGWITSFDQIALEPTEPLEPNADYYVRVRLHLSPRRTFSIWPWSHDDGSGRKDFTYIR